MGKYESQAKKYSNNVKEIGSLLDDVVSIVGSIEENLNPGYSKIDVITPEVIERNGVIRDKIKEIKSKSSATASTLVSKGREIDRKIEEEERRRLLAQQESSTTSSNNAAGGGS